MQFKEYKKVKEKLYFEKLENGMVVKILAKKGFKKKYVSLCVNFGAKDTEFSINDEQVKTPLGVAHFLEHLMFQMENGVDASDVLAKNGANSNAYTSYETVYYFSTIANVEKNISYLLDFVQSLNCTEEDVEEEKGIIEQEIKMSLDDPDDNLTTGVVRNLYKQGFINDEIAGTLDSIKEIDLGILRKVFNSFYRPDNMEILILGDVDRDKVLETIRNNQIKKDFDYSKVVKIKENYDFTIEIHKESGIKHMEVLTPKVAVAIKYPKIDFKLIDEFTLKILLKIIFLNAFSTTSNNYQEMIDLEIINGPLDISTYIIEGYNFTVLSVDSNKPNELIKYLRNIIEKIDQQTLDVESFETYKKGLIGSEMRRLANLSSIADSLASKSFKNDDFFDNLEKLEGIDIKMIHKITEMIKVSKVTNFVIEPKD